MYEKSLLTEPYDLILMDLQLPTLDGFSVTFEIFKLGKPFIVPLSARCLESDRLKCQEIGMNGFLSKPLKIADLKSCILECN